MTDSVGKLLVYLYSYTFGTHFCIPIVEFTLLILENLVSPTNWKTVQGGLNRISQALGPVLGKKVTYGVHVSKLDFDGDKMSV